MVPSGLRISQITAAGVRPAMAVRSQPASVWPARTSTPPGTARTGKMWPGCTRSDGGVARHRNLDGAGAVGGRDAGLDALGGLDRLGEIGAVSRAVAGGHQRQVQLAAALFGQRQADQAAPVRDHEVDGFGRDELGGHDQVALVLAVFLIDQDDDAAGAQLGDDLGDRGDAVGFRLGIGQEDNWTDMGWTQTRRESPDFTALAAGGCG